MAFEMFRAMMKEEWRLHAVMFGGRLFASFPPLIAAFAFITSLTLPVFTLVMPLREMALLGHMGAALLGVSAGGFGLFGKEVMNRRFGQASLLAYSSRALPVSERRIFFSFFIKDVLYYFALWIIPAIAGFALALPFVALFGLDISLAFLPLLAASIALSFLAGLSIIFLLSTIYAHSPRLLVAILVPLALVAAALWAVPGMAPFRQTAFAPFSFFLAPSMATLAASLVFVIVPALIAFAFLKVDYPERRRQFSNALLPLSRRLRFMASPHLASKDLLDLKRSEGGLGKLIFSLSFPAAFLWLMLSLLVRFMALDFMLLFSAMMGLLTTSVYGWLTEYDVFSSYAFLPIRPSAVIGSKVQTFLLISLGPFAATALAALATEPASFLPSVLAFVGVSSIALAATVYLTGMQTNILLYNPKILVQYLASIGSVLALVMLAASLNPLWLTASILLVPLSMFVLRKAYVRWDGMEQPTF